jgi:outer membrane protein OmpA-like peptidoglycan-associated protein
VSGAPVAVAFPPGSAVLPTSAFAALKALALRRADAPIAVTGYGDATSSDAAAQSAALPLALARARAIAANLLAAGVPANAIRINATATGSGGSAQLGN